MSIDIEQILSTVVREVFDDSADVRRWVDPEAPYAFLASIGSEASGERREIRLVATYGWFELTLDRGPSITMVEEDDDAGYKSDLLRLLARVGRSYLMGEGRLEHRRVVLRRRPTFVVTINGKEWRLGPFWSVGHLPEDSG